MQHSQPPQKKFSYNSSIDDDIRDKIKDIYSEMKSKRNARGTYGHKRQI